MAIFSNPNAVHGILAVYSFWHGCDLFSISWWKSTFHSLLEKNKKQKKKLIFSARSPVKWDDFKMAEAFEAEQVTGDLL